MKSYLQPDNIPDWGSLPIQYVCQCLVSNHQAGANQLQTNQAGDELSSLEHIAIVSQLWDKHLLTSHSIPLAWPTTHFPPPRWCETAASRSIATLTTQLLTVPNQTDFPVHNFYEGASQETYVLLRFSPLPSNLSFCFSVCLGHDQDEGSSSFVERFTINPQSPIIYPQTLVWWHWQLPHSSSNSPAAVSSVNWLRILVFMPVTILRKYNWHNLQMLPCTCRYILKHWLYLHYDLGLLTLILVKSRTQSLSTYSKASKTYQRTPRWGSKRHTVQACTICWRKEKALIGCFSGTPHILKATKVTKATIDNHGADHPPVCPVSQVRYHIAGRPRQVSIYYLSIT